MSKIQVNVDDLKNFADIIGDIENQCDDALRHLNWDFSSFLADLPGVSPKRVKEVEEIYRNVIKKYQAKLDHAQQLVKHTEAAMRQAEKSIGDKAGEFGLEMLGYYDVQRVFGEYDPITGEKVSGVDRLFATGMLALSLYPPGKAVGVTGKVAIKGANAGTKTSTKFGLSSIAKSLPSFISVKNVVSTGKVLEVFKGVYKQVVEAPLAATKLWMDRTVRQIADFRMPVIRTQLATPIGAMPLETVGEAFGQAKDTIVKMVKTGEVPVVTRGTGELNKDLAKAYLRDIEEKTGQKVNKEQINLIKETLRKNNYEKLTPKETAKHRSKFTTSLKDKLIAEWEDNTNQKWPRYTEEVFDKNGEVARSNGQPYDAHHIIENNFGGPHEWWNIHPAKYPNEHQAGIHGKGAPSGKLFPRR